MPFLRRKRVRPRGAALRPVRRPQSKERQFQEKKRNTGVIKRKIGKVLSQIWVIISLMVFVAAVLGMVYVVANFSVQDIRVQRADVRVDGRDIAIYARKYIGRNMFLLSRNSVITELQAQFPEIEGLTIAKNYPNELSFTISTKPIAFRWACQRMKKELNEQGDIIEKPISELYYVNMDGRVSLPTEEEKEAFLIYEKTECPQNIKRRDRIIPAESVVAIFRAKDLLERVLGTTIDRSGYYSDAREIHLITTEETAVWIDFVTPVQDQVAKLAAALELEPDLQNPQKHIDLRVSNKIFYAPK
jgi:hypothetical protein